MSTTIGKTYVAECRRRLAACHGKINHCLKQLNDTQVWSRPRESMNSIANLVLHLCGNVRQWIISGIGGEPDVRDRPKEFSERNPIPKDELIRRLDAIVRQADTVLAQVIDEQLLEPRRIQGFDETVLSATFESLAHFNGHTQEIIYITRLQLGDAYQFFWRPATREQGAGA
jgi:uncharacterized damage-inducible protein DinB